jgi:hypothetical protein
MSFNLFGPASKDDIRVGYISTERGFVDGLSVCEANDYAKKNPGTRFIFRTRDEIEYIGINDVNKLTPDDLLPSSASECPGVQLETDCGPSKVYFYGGGGVGAKANPVIGKDGSLLAVDLVSGGFGYQYAPITEVKDKCGIGAGSVVRSVLGEIVETVEYYDQEEDFEEYDICPPTEVGYGRLYSPDGKDIGEWDPTIYANLSKDPISREIKAYQDFLASLKGGYRFNESDKTIHDWWTTRLKAPLKLTYSNKTTRSKFNVTDAPFLEKQKKDGVQNPVGWNEFMNTYAISPVPPSNVSGSDFAGIPFTFEWEEDFPYDGDYVFRGLCDNSAQLYLDNVLLDNLRGFRDTPNKVKKSIKAGVHRIRLDLLNTPIKEKVITQSVITQVAGCDFIKRGNDFYMLVGGNVNTKISLQLSYDDDPNNAGTAITRIVIPNPGGTDLVLERKKTSSGSYERTGTVKQSEVFPLNDVTGYGPIRFEGTPKTPKLAKPNLFYGPKTDRYGQIDFFDLDGSDVNAKLNILNAENLQQSRLASTSTSTSTKVFNTIDYINKSNRKLWKTNIYNRGGFLNQYGICPFDTNLKLEDNPYAGTHEIVWDNIDFPIDGNYIIEVEVDDNVNLSFAGPQETIVITKKGFSSGDKSTGKTTETKYFKKGKYKITAELEQIPGGKFRFDDSTKGINPMALAVNVTTAFTSEEVISPKSWIENPMGVALTIDAPLPPIPQEPIVEQEGRCPKNPIWSTRYPGASDKWYPVNFSSPKTVTQTIATTSTPASSNTQEVEFTIYGAGAIKDLSFVFTAVTGSHTFTLNGAEKNKKTRTEKIKILKNTNYIVSAKEDSKKFTSVEQGLIKGGTKAKEQGIGESKKIFADYTSTRNDNDDIQITSSIGTFKSSNKRKAPNSKRNTYDLTFRLDAAPGAKPETTTRTTTYQVPGWSKFMNRYAISPVPPLNKDGTDGTGRVYRNSWNVDIPYDGFYAIKGTVDNFGKILIDGKEITGTKKFKSPYRFRQEIPDPDPLTLGIPAINNAFSDGLSSSDILVEAANQGFKINPSAQPLLKQGSQQSRNSSSSKLIDLDSFGEENPKATKIFLTKGMHSIQIEVENKKVETFVQIDKKIFNTSDWVSSTQPIKTEEQPPGGYFFKKGNDYYLKVGGNDLVGLKLELAYNDSPFTAGIAISKVTIPSNDGKVVLEREVSGSTFKEKGSVTKKGLFKANQDYGPIIFEGLSKTPVIANTGNPQKDPGTFQQRITFFDNDGSDTNASLTLIPPPEQLSGARIIQQTPQITTKNGVSYSGPILATYANGTLGPFLTPAFNGDDDYRARNMGRSWKSVWSNVDFPEDGQYDLKTEADDEVIVRVDGIEVGRAKVFEGVRNFTFNATRGKKTIELEFKNIPGNSNSTFTTNPVVFNTVITKKVSVSTNIGKPWTVNPMGISAVLIPPPCPKLIKGKGVITEVIVEEPGNGNPSVINPPTPGVVTIPIALRLKRVEVVSSGINYNCGVDQIQITPNNGAILDYTCDTFGRIRNVIVRQGGFGFTEYPDITMQTETGINAQFRPVFEPIRDPIVEDPTKLIQVTDLVGLKQTGYVDGRAYYGAVFYKDGIRYAGFYETPGELVQIYDTLQESINAQVTTAPSAILRQGTDTNSNNPRLNLPGTPENLI